MLISVAGIPVSVVLREVLETPSLSGSHHHSGRWAPVSDMPRATVSNDGASKSERMLPMGSRVHLSETCILQDTPSH